MIGDEDETEEEAVEAVARDKLLEIFDAEKQVAELVELLADPRFQNLMWRILERCAVFEELFDPNFGKMGFLAGQRNVGIWLLRELSAASPDSVLEMQRRWSQARLMRAAVEKARAARKRRRHEASP